MIAAEQTLHPILVIIILVLAVGAGLWVGNNLGDASRKANKARGRATKDESIAASLGKQAQGLLSGSALRLYKWRRDRKRKQRERERESSQ
ncbi:MAG: hypothetical protein R3A79_02930 [Nannocystaceae bacterium]